MKKMDPERTVFWKRGIRMRIMGVKKTTLLIQFVLSEIEQWSRFQKSLR